MPGFTTVTACFDESGKFRDRDVVCFGGVASYAEDLTSFGEEWSRLLVRNGLKSLSAKDALNFKRPLGIINNDTSKAKRALALLPFVHCIRKHLLAVTAVTISVPGFKKSPSHVFQFFGNDPIYVAFTRAILHVLDFTPDRDKVSFICDDDEQSAVSFFRLYRRLKNVWPDAKKKLMGISFVDDQVLFALQAADLVAALARLEAGRRWFKIKHPYPSLFKELTKNPEKHEKLWLCDVAFAGEDTLTSFGKDLGELWKKAQSEKKSS
jgi:hypothetical protein